MTAPTDALTLLSRTPLFAGVGTKELEPLLADFRSRRYATDSYIFREGDPGDHLHLVATGQVRISRTTEAGGEIVFAILGAGEVFGELAVLHQTAVRSADAQAIADTECFVLHREAVVAFLKNHPAIMWRVVTVLSDYIRRKDEAFADLAFNDIPGRVARKVLELAEARGEKLEHTSVELSQRTLAGMVGASRENVNRALSRFATLGLIKLERGRITVLRAEELRRRSD